ncbi:STAS domain-containing protein [Phycisphaera mikurensis]|uniref:Putative antagonist protein n=1 Tax=Phycisphaera mikurensis (strain NBRC 102666 / KCTC 22515 / FYK2301M01) TaxID=1142394 RepID=I0IGG6_PHYMF|nr:STAS domain-containing protein [Phycisphaera mikurensis]MBB6442963.1 anti-sigma B factor antagonist [Phycisphaera mikurensis]BAM04354.1 putative antagonist protein [Phycisphaera mikurensis NBRC 102666]
MSEATPLQANTPLIHSASKAEEDGVRTLTVELTGDLTVGNAPELLEGMRGMIDRHDASRVVLRFADVGYVDSGALGALIEVRKTIGKRGGEVVLERMPKELAGLLRIMKLDAVFTLRGDEPAGAPAAPGAGA